MTLDSRIEQAITETTGDTARISSSYSVLGGSINASRILSLDDNRQYFVKTNAKADSLPGMFESEYAGLALLTKPGVIRVPKALVCTRDFIVMEVVNEGQQKPEWQELMGRQLALLHKSTQQKRFGFERDNYLGITPQPNSWMVSWLDFWREQRLGWQLELFSRKTEPSDQLLASGDRLLAKLDELLTGVDEPAVLIHGDLWSGNAFADEKGDPVIFDPACYFAHREAEIGMMRLFGGFGPRCEAAYQEVWPLQSGSEQRITLYRLYHELNHLNLFGRSYYQACLSTMQQLL